MAGEIETVDEASSEAGGARIVARWLRELEESHSSMMVRGRNNKREQWEKRGRKIVDLYRDEHQPQQVKFNILLTTTEILKPSLFSQAPKPDVRRRHTDSRQPRPVERAAAQTIERALAYTIDEQGFAQEMEAIVEDYLLPGRGTGRVRFEARMSEPRPERLFVEREEIRDEFSGETIERFTNGGEPVDPTEVQLDDDGAPFVPGEPIEDVLWSEVRWEHVYWENFRHSPARNWRGVRWVAFREYLTREELVEQFGDTGKRVELTADHSTDERGGSQDEALDDMFKRAEVWEIWNKRDRKVYVVSPGLRDEPLAVFEDPLGLTGFFPSPEPAIFYKTTNTMTPVPAYVSYQSLAEELYVTQQRIDYIVKRLKLVGFYPGDRDDEVSKALNAGLDTAMIPVGDFKQWQAGGGAKGLIDWMPIRDFADVLTALRQHRAELLQMIREITGITDIQRGQTNPREPFRSQQLKAEFGSARQQNPRLAIERMVRDAYALMAEVMAEQFDPDTLREMSGMDLPSEEERAAAQQALQAAQAAAQAPEGQQGMPPEQAAEAQRIASGPTWEEVVELLQTEKLRLFRINVETESTVAPDADMERQRRTEFLTALVQLLQQVLPAVAEGSMPPDLAKSMITFGVRGFKAGRELEEALEMVDVQSMRREGPTPEQEIEIAKIKSTDRRDQQRTEIQVEEAKTKRIEVIGGLLVEAGKLQQSQIESQQRLAAELMERALQLFDQPEEQARAA